MARPIPDFEGFYEQDVAARHVRKLIEGALERGQPCPPLLLIGRYGSGKSTFAQAISRKSRVGFYPWPAGKDLSIVMLCEALKQLSDCDIIFLDEAHALPRPAQEILQLALDQWKIPQVKNGHVDRRNLVSIARFTPILATNEPGSLRPALRSRFERIEFRPYTVRALTAIARVIAPRFGFELTPQAARVLAEVAQASPRLVEMRIKDLGLYFPAVTKMTQDNVSVLLENQGIDKYGLWPAQRQYLQILAAKPQKACTLERLTLGIGMDATMVRQEYEPYLIEQEFIEISNRGRAITEKGKALATEYTAIERAADEAAEKEEEGC